MLFQQNDDQILYHSCQRNATSLWFNQHPAVNDERVTEPKVVVLHAGQARRRTPVIPPTSAVSGYTVAPGPQIIVLVICRKLHPVVVVVAKPSVILVVTFILEAVASVPAVSGHFQLIFAGPITDLERPVLG